MCYKYIILEEFVLFLDKIINQVEYKALKEYVWHHWRI